MNYCNQCGERVEERVPEGDNRPRYVCGQCSVIHYQNPNIVTGTLPMLGDKVLLCRRAIEPRYGLWTLPAGFLENGESVQDGALRETYEEAYATVELIDLYTVFTLPVISQVYMLFRAQLLDMEFGPGPESLEVKLFSKDEIPWDELAFHVVYETLVYYFKDQKSDNYQQRVGIIERLPGEGHQYKTTLMGKSHTD